MDADIIAFVISVRCSRSIDWDGDGSPTENVDIDTATFQANCWLNDLKRKTRADTATLCLSDPSRKYHRHDEYPLYKAGRTQGKPPAMLATIKGILRNGVDGFESKWVNRLEGDDVMGVLATNPIATNVEYVLATKDKDLRQVKGTFYDLGSEKEQQITKAAGDLWFYTQCLTGDATDGYPGCPRIGPKKAEAILLNAMAKDPSEEHVWSHILAAYERVGLDEEYALSQARCARILQWTDYDMIRKEVIPWTPTRSTPASA